jgi:surfeit locus 1 family protein
MTAAAPRRRFRPRLVPTLVALPLFLALLGLGTWQMERREWKLALIADMQARLAMPPAPLTELLALGPAANYRPVYAVGVYRHDREMLLEARTYHGQLGMQVVTPLELTEARSREDAGGGARAAIDSVLVNRGWIPADRRDPGTRAAGQAAGEVAVTGILRWPQRPSYFTPDNHPDRGQWYWADVQAMARAADLAHPAPAVIEAGRDAAAPDRLPVGGQTIVDVPNNHLQYAITWYALAAVLLATYIMSQRRVPGAEPPRRTLI